MTRHQGIITRRRGNKGGGGSMSTVSRTSRFGKQKLPKVTSSHNDNGPTSAEKLDELKVAMQSERENIKKTEALDNSFVSNQPILNSKKTNKHNQQDKDFNTALIVQDEEHKVSLTGKLNELEKQGYGINKDPASILKRKTLENMQLLQQKQRRLLLAGRGRNVIGKHMDMHGHHTLSTMTKRRRRHAGMSHHKPTGHTNIRKHPQQHHQKGGFLPFLIPLIPFITAAASAMATGAATGAASYGVTKLLQKFGGKGLATDHVKHALGNIQLGLHDFSAAAKIKLNRAVKMINENPKTVAKVATYIEPVIRSAIATKLKSYGITGGSGLKLGGTGFQENLVNNLNELAVNR